MIAVRLGERRGELEDVRDAFVRDSIDHGPPVALRVDEAAPPQARQVVRDPALGRSQQIDELGDGALHGDCAAPPECSATPVQVSGVADATDIATGADFGCAVVDGGVRCWGSLGDIDGRSVPVELP